MDLHLRLVAMVGAVGLLLIVLDLVRRRRLLERYALVWLAVTVALIVLTVSGRVLDGISALIGVAYPPSALFVIAFGFVIFLLLHFSVAVSKLSDQSRVLAQQLSLLEERMRRQEARSEEDEAAERELERSEL